MTDAGPRFGGLPLLSGPPPALSDNARGTDACRKCNKEFNVFNLFNRPKQCNHCGYLYCSSCTDYHALMPRSLPNSSGYDTKPVCAFCIEYLNVTASGRAQLKDLPVSKLKQYIKAYGIKVNRAVEKDDYIDAILSARGPNGCLSADAERYYRKYSVPDRTGSPARGLFSRSGVDTNTRTRPSRPQPPPSHRQSSFARPDLDPNYQRPPATTQPTPASSRPTSQPPLSRSRHSDPSSHSFPTGSPPSNATNLNVPPAATTAPPPRARTTSTAPPPSLDQLLEMSPEAINALSISTLKAVLFANHVNARLILEKAELVTKVNVLIEEEKHVRERHRLAEEQEREQERLREQARQEELERERQRREGQQAPTPEAAPDSAPDSVVESAIEPGLTQGTAPVDEPKPSSPPRPPVTPPKIPTSSPFAERSGLCVICQDEEATIVIVDCGHLCLCRDCSGIVMQSSKECPLCRTRIVTEQRLLRVFRT